MPQWDAPMTLSKQIYESLREKIETEELAPNATVPPIRQLMEEFGAANHTVQRAMRELRAAGLVITSPSSKTVVRDRPKLVERSIVYTRAPAQGESIDYGAKTELLQLAEVPARPYIAELLEVEAGTSVLMRRRLMRRDGVPTEIVASFYPTDIAAGTELASERPLKGGSPGALKRLGYECEKSPEWVHARLPLRSEVEILQTSPESPVLRLLRAIRTASGRPVEAIEMVMKGDDVVLFYDL